MERRCYTNEQYYRKKSLEIMSIPASVPDNGLESKVLEVLEEIDVLFNPSFVEDYHRLPTTATIPITGGIRKRSSEKLFQKLRWKR